MKPGLQHSANLSVSNQQWLSDLCATGQRTKQWLGDLCATTYLGHSFPRTVPWPPSPLACSHASFSKRERKRERVKPSGSQESTPLPHPPSLLPRVDISKKEHTCPPQHPHSTPFTTTQPTLNPPHKHTTHTMHNTHEQSVSYTP